MKSTHSIDVNAVKASFDDIYVSADPRAYYSTLGSLDYAIPDLARPIIRQIADAWRAQSGRSATILDIGASYGINAALMRYPLTFDMIRRRYARREMLSLATEDLQRLDRCYFQSWPRTRSERMIGLDSSQPALAYAEAVGLLDAGIAENFERAAPSAGACAMLEGVDIVVSTGAVGYVTQKTFAHIAAQPTRPPWIVSFVLRMVDYAPVTDRLARMGLMTEKLSSAAFLQRRFRDAAEAADVLDLLERRGVNAEGFEAEGLLFAELYVSRPPEAVAALPLDRMATIASGRNWMLGPRLLQLWRNGRKEIMSAR
ncbi:MAG: hypothetical protein NW203_11540 [Hyphomonadaceae bacterium]|nr:hypothetical protein [Hyphomonadaceae bacterium]